MPKMAYNLMRPLAVALVIVLTMLTGCKNNDNAAPTASATLHPRLITFSPAITQTVFDMGLGEYVVGVSNYCTLPPGEERPKVGAAINIRAEPILAVKPDIILAQQARKKLEVVTKINPDIKIEHFIIETLADIGQAMARIGRITGHEDIGEQHQQRYLNTLKKWQERCASLPRRKTVFVMGYQNPSGPGQETFIDEMITLAGGSNTLAPRHNGWASISVEEIIQAQPEVIICQCHSNEADDAQRYWQNLGKDQWQRRVFVITDSLWTIPAAHLADYLGELAMMIHPELKETD